MEDPAPKPGAEMEDPTPKPGAPKVDGASLLSLSLVLKLSNTLDLRFTAYHFYLDLIYSSVIGNSYLLVRLIRLVQLVYSFYHKLSNLDLLRSSASLHDFITEVNRLWI